MSDGVIREVTKVADHKASKGTPLTTVSDELPTVADLVLPETGLSFSDEFGCFLEVLGHVRKPA